MPSLPFPFPSHFRPSTYIHTPTYLHKRLRLRTTVHALFYRHTYFIFLRPRTLFVL
ncbi:hypothetical protein B0H19DRAFT_1130604 [Mycena capillaripes]|nr:hypothetical protein B0H19DRAFT_1130604 [Mycena capillaripes]